MLTYESFIMKKLEPPKFKVGDEVMIISDFLLNTYGYPDLKNGDLVKIIGFHRYSDNNIAYDIDSPSISRSLLPERYFDYEWNVNAKKYNL